MHPPLRFWPKNISGRLWVSTSLASSFLVGCKDLGNCLLPSFFWGFLSYHTSHDHSSHKSVQNGKNLWPKKHVLPFILGRLAYRIVHDAYKWPCCALKWINILAHYSRERIRICFCLLISVFLIFLQTVPHKWSLLIKIVSINQVINEWCAYQQWGCTGCIVSW